MKLDRRALLRYVAVTGATTLAGCASAPQNTPTPEETATPTPEATATPTPTAGGASESLAQQKYPDYDWGLLEEAEPTATTTIKMTADVRFQPTIAKVSKGATVTWKNPSYEHTLAIPALDVNRSVPGGEQTSVTVTQAGTFDYVCTLHPPTMLGRLIVTES